MKTGQLVGAAGAGLGAGLLGGFFLGKLEPSAPKAHQDVLKTISVSVGGDSGVFPKLVYIGKSFTDYIEGVPCSTYIWITKWELRKSAFMVMNIRGDSRTKIHVDFASISGDEIVVDIGGISTVIAQGISYKTVVL